MESDGQDDVAESTRTSSGSLDMGSCHDSKVEEERSTNNRQNNQVLRISRSRKPFKSGPPRIPSRVVLRGTTTSK